MTDQTLGQIVTEALTLLETLKAQGLDRVEQHRSLETVLRDAWPKPADRAEPWHDACTTCRDYGLEMLTCPGDATCGRHTRHGAHEYGKPCWCPAGRRHHAKAAPSAEDAMTLAAKPRKAPSRWGRS